MTPPLPPFAEWWARRLLPPWAVEDVVGDLTEMYAARGRRYGRWSNRIWLYGQVVTLRFSYARYFQERSMHERTGPVNPFADFTLDLRQAARSLVRSRDYTVAAVIALGVGIGATAAVYTVARQVFFRPLPFGDEDRIVVLEHTAPGAPVAEQPMSYPEIEDYRNGLTTLTGVASYSVSLGTVLGLGEPDRLFVASVSLDYFDVLAVPPVLGRTFGEADANASVVLVSYEYWTERLGADASVLGRSIRLDERPHDVVGVLPPLPNYPNDAALYVPATSQPMFARFSTTRNVRMMTAIGRLRDGVRLETASREVNQTATAFVAQYPDQYPAEYDLTATVAPIRTKIVGAAASTIWILGITAVLVLLLVCINVANMSMARLARRDGELAVRVALGAGPGRVARYHAAEGILLAGAGWIVGMILAAASLGPLARWAALTTPHVAGVGFDGTVLAFAAVVAFAAGIIAAGVPALRAVRHSHVVGRLAVTRASAGKGWLRWQHALLAGQVAASLVLVVAAALFGRSLLALQAVDYGFESDQVLTMRVALNRSYRGAGSARSLALYDELLERLAAQPGVAAAGIGRDVPLAGGSVRTAEITIVGRSDPAPAVGDLRVVSPEYFGTLGLAFAAGRNFDRNDGTDTPPVAIVNETFAHRYWPDLDPIGRTFLPPRAETPVTVVGVVTDVRHYGLDTAPVPEFYVPLRQSPLFGWYLFVRAAAGVDPSTLTRRVVNLIHDIDPVLPIHQIRTLDAVLREGMAPPAFRAQVVGLFGALGLIVTCAGVFGLTAFSVGTRLRELGIRIALGAGAREVIGSVLAQTLGFTAIGLGLGLLGALTLRRLVDGLLFGVTALDPLNLLAAMGVVLASAFVAAMIPAHRATRVDPMIVFRS